MSPLMIMTANNDYYNSNYIYSVRFMMHIICWCCSLIVTPFSEIQFEKNFNISSFSMIKWFAYIVVLLIFAPCLASAKIKNNHFKIVNIQLGVSLPGKEMLIDTTAKKSNKKQEQEDKTKIKEVAKAKRQPKPEKIESTEHPATQKPKPRPKRQRRPEGLERPPEIPRRSN